jgi:cyclase
VKSRLNRIAAVGAAVAGVAAALVTGATAQQDFSKTQVDVVQVRDNVWLLAAEGGSNVTLFNGPDGALVVDTHFAPMAPKFIDAIRKLVGDSPLRYVVNTHVHGDHTGGNEAISKAGRFRAGGNVVGDIGGAATATANIVAHENVLTRLSKTPEGQPPTPSGTLPTVTFFNNQRDMLFNGEAVQMIHQPSAHTDGDIVVFFRRSDVVSTGDLFTTVMYPFIDEANGGTTNGFIAALNAILNITVPSNVNEGGTLVIPGHGRVSDEQDVIEYRDILTIVRDRIQEYVKRGMTLEQVKAKKPTLYWDARYNTNSFWTADQFIGQIYKDMVALNPPPAPARNQRRGQTPGSGK